MRDNKVNDELISHIHNSQCSFLKIFNERHELLQHDEIYYFENKEVQTKYIDNIIMKIQRSAGAKKILKLDISNCYDSIYTHFFSCSYIRN